MVEESPEEPPPRSPIQFVTDVNPSCSSPQKLLVVPIQPCRGLNSQTSHAATNRMTIVNRQPLRQPSPGIFIGLALRCRGSRDCRGAGASGCCGGGAYR